MGDQRKAHPSDPAGRRQGKERRGVGIGEKDAWIEERWIPGMKKWWGDRSEKRSVVTVGRQK